METLILLHLAAGVVTTVAYKIMTGDSPTYIMAMVAMYQWALVMMWAGTETIKDFKERRRKRCKRNYRTEN